MHGEIADLRHSDRLGRGTREEHFYYCYLDFDALTTWEEGGEQMGMMGVQNICLTSDTLTTWEEGRAF